MDRARFLLAQLHMDSLKDKTSPKLIKKALEALPKGSNALDLAYHGAMQRIEDQLEGFRLLAKQLLGWLTYSQRLMSVQEVQHALAIEPGAPDFDEDNLGDIDEIVGFCAGLVIVDGETHIIRLVHYTTQEYFRRNGDKILASAQLEIAISCLTYLLYENFGAGWVIDKNRRGYRSVKARIQRYPFLEYAAMYWAYHTGRCEQRNVKELFMSFAKDDRKVSSASQVVLALNENRFFLRDVDETKSRNPLSAMHIIAYFGYEEMISELLYYGFAADTEDSTQRTPLWWAARQGRKAVVSLLLSQNYINVNHHGLVGNKHYQIPFETPLAIAAQRGNAQVMKLLIQREDMDVNLPDRFGSSPLQRAVQQAEIEAVELLLTREDIDVNSKDKSGMTPLLSAVIEGQTEMVKHLLRHGHVQVEDLRGEAQIAAREGRTSIVKLLLSHIDIDVNAKVKDGSTPLHTAVKYGHTSMVELLLGCVSIDVNSRDRNGSTPLHGAAGNGYEAIVTMLFEKGDIEANPKNYKGNTPLTDSIISHRPAIVRLLCAHPDVDLDPRDNEGRDLFSLVKLRQESLVKLRQESLLKLRQESLVKLEQERIPSYLKRQPSKNPSAKFYSLSSRGKSHRIDSSEEGSEVTELAECLEILRSAIETRARHRYQNLQPVPS